MKTETMNNVMEKINALAFALGEAQAEQLLEQKAAEPAETPEEKALDMVKHLTAAFNLPVFIGVSEEGFLQDACGELIAPEPLVKSDEFCIIRTYSAGVFAGYIEQMDGKTAVLKDVRRIWSWEGACSLSQLAVDGTSKPESCRFAVPVEKIVVTEVIEILPCTERAKKSILGVKKWKC